MTPASLISRSRRGEQDIAHGRLLYIEKDGLHIYGAATDGTNQLRYIATNDIKPLIRARRETSEEEYITFMHSQFGAKS